MFRFDHFQIRPTFAVTPNLILEPCPKLFGAISRFAPISICRWTPGIFATFKYNLQLNYADINLKRHLRLRKVEGNFSHFGKVFFQLACRIILGPPKHVLHLVWSAYIISTAIRAALKIARRSQILWKRRPVLKRKFDCFWNGTKRKILFWLLKIQFSTTKMGVNLGGSEGVSIKDQTVSILLSVTFPYCLIEEACKALISVSSTGCNGCHISGEGKIFSMSFFASACYLLLV